MLSYPSAQITWKKNNKKINDNNKKFKIVYSTNLSYLRVTDASHTINSLNITCHVENHRGSTESHAYLNVLSDTNKPKQFPEMTISNPKSVEPEAPFKLECNLTNIIHPSNILWYQSNRLIQYDNNKYYSNWTALSDGSIRNFLYVKGLPLSIGDSQEIDFACMATNSFITNLVETSILLRSK